MAVRAVVISAGELAVSAIRQSRPSNELGGGVGFVSERCRSAQQSIIAVQIGDIVAQPGNDLRPLIEQLNDDDVAGASRIVLHVVDKRSIADRAGGGQGFE